jgi:hypothetical protein
MMLARTGRSDARPWIGRAPPDEAVLAQRPVKRCAGVVRLVLRLVSSRESARCWFDAGWQVFHAEGTRCEVRRAAPHRTEPNQTKPKLTLRLALACMAIVGLWDRWAELSRRNFCWAYFLLATLGVGGSPRSSSPRGRLAIRLAFFRRL